MRHRDKCTKRELLSLIGKLSFYCKLLPAGRIFLRRLIDFSSTVTHLHHHIGLTTEAHLDFQWWIEFLPHWWDTSLILNHRWTPSSTLNLYTNASGVHGWGAYWDGRWIQSHRSLSQRDMDITWKEMYAIVLAVHTWGSSWARQKILFHCDNQAVVEIWDRGSTRAPHTMGLDRLLYFCASRCDINVCVTHVSGVCNDIADSLSRFQIEKFRKLASRSIKYPDHIPAWPTQSFMSAFCNAGIMELSSPQDGHINQDSKNSKHSVTNMILPQPQRHHWHFNTSVPTNPSLFHH